MYYLYECMGTRSRQWGFPQKEFSGVVCVLADKQEKGWGQGVERRTQNSR